MKFSVLVANYNNGRFFRDCYESVLKQTHTDWEMVIVDDASTDNSVEIIENIIRHDSRCRFIKREKNEGVGVVKALLIDLANGEICGYLDPDDALLPNALAASVSIFKTEPKTILTYSRLAKCDENLNILSEFKSAMQVPNGSQYFFNFPIQIAPFIGFRKETYLKCEKMNPKLRIAEDQDLYLKLYEKGDVRFINQTDYLYRGHSGGISQNDNKQKSYGYWGEAIWLAMKRRGLKTINGQKVPEKFTDSSEIFKLLEYQNKIPFRIKKKLKLLFGI